jgi:hypothetical protein
MTEEAFEIRSTKHPTGARVWLDDKGHLHIQLLIDNTMDVIIENAKVVRPRSVFSKDE